MTFSEVGHDFTKMGGAEGGACMQLRYSEMSSVLEGQAARCEELRALFSSIANQLTLSEVDVENVLSKMVGAGVSYQGCVYTVYV